MAFPASLLWRWLDQWRRAKGLAPQVRTIPDGKVFLHVGCGPAYKDQAGRGFQSADWGEIRFDIDPDVRPDIVGSMLDMSMVASESIDAVYSSHNIEHLYPHQVPLALQEFWRVLKPTGCLVLTCPDLQAACRRVADDGLTDTAYVSPAGPISPLDILYGHRPQLAAGNLFMAHHTGFTLKTLLACVEEAGFASLAGLRRESALDLWVVASKSPMDEQAMAELAGQHLPAC